MLILQVIVVAIAVGGVVLSVTTGLHIAKVRHVKESVLVTGRFSNSQINQIRHSVRRSGKLPSDTSLRAATVTYAREETTYGPYIYGWMPWQLVGVAAAASVLYLIPGLAIEIVVGIVQLFLVLMGWGAAGYARQGLVPARAIVKKYVDGEDEVAGGDTGD